MQVNWDIQTYKRMAECAQQEADAARKWIDDNQSLSDQFVAKVNEGHPAIWFSSVMRLVEEGIDAKKQDAVDLGCRYVIQQEKTPFGKIHKSNILIRLKRNRELIKQKYIIELIKTYENYQKMNYTPREVRELSKLVREFMQNPTAES